jgi:hypothetical protein
MSAGNALSWNRAGTITVEDPGGEQPQWGPRTRAGGGCRPASRAGWPSVSGREQAGVGTNLLYNQHGRIPGCGNSPGDSTPLGACGVLGNFFRRI